MIVIHHSVGLFGIECVGINWGQGVSFFFVLSGFILTYVYPSLDNWSEIKQFWRARVARILPAYLASFLLGFWLVHYAWNGQTAIAYLLMVQAWIPLSTYYFSYNGVCWSISAEFFFYIVFPFLLYKWHKNWFFKLSLSVGILMFLLAISNALSLPDYGDPRVGSDGLMITQHGLIYINPLSRIFEFIVGMIIATASRKQNRSASSIWATFYEIGAIIICAASMYYMNFIAAWSSLSILGPATALWLIHCGSVFAFGFLIYIMARGRGKISKILATPFLVFLGEISFSLYLIHYIFLTLYRFNISYFSGLSNFITFVIFSTILLLSSYLMWAFIEMPGRKLILGRRKIHGSEIIKKTWRDYLARSRKPFLAGLVLLGIIGLLLLKASIPVQVSIPGIESFSEINFKSPTKEPKMSSGYFDLINNSLDQSHSLPKNLPFQICGWAVYSDHSKPADLVILTEKENHTPIALILVTLDRPDISEAYHKIELAKSGWCAAINPSVLSGDRVTLRAWAYEARTKAANLLSNTHEIRLY